MTMKTYAMTTPSGEVVTFQTEADLPQGNVELELVGVAGGGGATTQGGGGPDPVKPT